MAVWEALLLYEESAGGAFESRRGHTAKAATSNSPTSFKEDLCHSAGSFGYSVRHSSDNFAKYCILRC